MVARPDVAQAAGVRSPSLQPPPELVLRGLQAMEFDCGRQFGLAVDLIVPATGVRRRHAVRIFRGAPALSVADGLRRFADAIERMQTDLELEPDPGYEWDFWDNL